MQEKLQTLKLKKARIFLEIESLSQVSDSVFLQLGKTVAEIMKIEKQLVRDTINLTDEN